MYRLPPLKTEDNSIYDMGGFIVFLVFVPISFCLLSYLFLTVKDEISVLTDRVYKLEYHVDCILNANI